MALPWRCWLECSLDPLAIVEVSDMRKETKVAKRTNAPKWDASFSFNVTNEAAFVEVRGCCGVGSGTGSSSAQCP